MWCVLSIFLKFSKQERDDIIVALRAKLAEKEISHEFFKQTHTPEQQSNAISKLQNELEEVWFRIYGFSSWAVLTFIFLYILVKLVRNINILSRLNAKRGIPRICLIIEHIENIKHFEWLQTSVKCDQRQNTNKQGYLFLDASSIQHAMSVQGFYSGINSFSDLSIYFHE